MPIRQPELLGGNGYTFFLRNQSDVSVGVIKSWVWFSYTLSANQVGTLELTVPATDIPEELLERDSRIEIWRRAGLGPERLEGQTQWFIRRTIYNYVSQVYTIIAYSALNLIDRRVIAYNSGTSQASKTDAADSMIVEFVDENLGSAATDTDRDWSSKITIIAAAGTAPTVHKAASRRRLLRTIQEVAKQAAHKGTPVFFDMSYNLSNRLYEFRTYLNQLGVDRTTVQNIQLSFSPETSTMSDVIREDDFSRERSFVYAAGQGQGVGRQEATASDSDIINSSPFGRVEAVTDARSIDNADELTAEAESVLRDTRAKRTLKGRIVNVDGATYGVNWNWGDKVNVSLDEETFTARLDVVSISVSERGEESITADIRIEE